MDKEQMDKKRTGCGCQELRNPFSSVNEGENPGDYCCCNEKKVRSEKEYKDLCNRLSRIEGQVRGIRRMLENDAYCIDMITQVSAVNAALNSFNKVLLSNHIRTCVADELKNGEEAKMEELLRVLPRLMK